MKTISKVRCDNCKAEYYIHWINFDNPVEYCANCGCGSDETFLEITEMSVKEVFGDDVDSEGGRADMV